MNNVSDLEDVSRRLFPYYLFVLFWIPIPLGSNRPLAWGGISIIVFFLLAIYLWSYAREKLRPVQMTSSIKLVIGLLFIWLMYQVLQIVPLPIEFVRTLSSAMVDIKIGANADNVNFISLSIDSVASWHEIIKTSLYLSMFLLTIFLVNSRERVRTLYLTIVFIAVAQSVWGLTDAFIEQNYHRGIGNTEYLSQITGTFINRNHFAAFLNISIAAIIGLVLGSGIREKRQIHRDNFRHHWQSRILDWRIYLVPYFALLVVTLVLTQSRGAIVSFVAMMMVLAVSFLMMKMSFSNIYRNYKWLFWIVFFMLLIFIADMLSMRLNNFESDFHSRLSIWRTSLEIAKDFWITGVGPGNFQFIFPVYDSGVIVARVEHAHNDYLELLVEQGIIGISLFTSIVLICIWSILKHVRSEKDLRKNAYALAALVGIVSFLFHSVVDFSYHIPANAVYFFVFLGVGMLQGMEYMGHEQREASWDDEVFNPSIDECELINKTKY